MDARGRGVGSSLEPVGKELGKVSDIVQIEKNGDIAVLKFNRAAALNALSMELARGIADGLIELDERDVL